MALDAGAYRSALVVDQLVSFPAVAHPAIVHEATDNDARATPHGPEPFRLAISVLPSPGRPQRPTGVS
jgi:hypothetical protein